MRDDEIKAKKFNDSRDELFPDIGTPAWKAREQGDTRYERPPCPRCGGTIGAVFAQGDKKCLGCKRQEPKNNSATTSKNKVIYRTRKKDAIPSDGYTPDEVRRLNEIHEECRRITEETGIPHHVDHIKPISKGGMHHPDNLQILTAKQNCSKGAKYNDPSGFTKEKPNPPSQMAC